MSRDRNVTLSVNQAPIELDDRDLIVEFERAKKDFESKEKEYYINEKNLDENDYLSYIVARMAYEFAKEEYEALLKEVEKRRLMTRKLV